MSALPSHAYEPNDEWEGLVSFTDDLPGWEGLDPLGEDDPDQGGCIRCGRDPQGHREPFGGYPCCLWRDRAFRAATAPGLPLLCSFAEYKAMYDPLPWERAAGVQS